MLENKSRSNMSLKEEQAFVNKMFSEFETEVANEFWTPYEQHADKVGMAFTVLGRVTEEDADLECLPMWRIRFNTGEEIEAWPEEIISSQIASFKNYISA